MFLGISQHSRVYLRYMQGRITVPTTGTARPKTLPDFSGIWNWLMRHRIISLLLAFILIGAIIAAMVTLRTRTEITYITQPVVRQDLAQSVTASGTVNPQNTVAIGSQSSGTIAEIYVDYNSKVKKGEVLARIDPTQLQAQLDQANASLVVTEAQAQAQAANASGAQSGVAVAQAGIQTAQSNVSKAQSAYTLAQATLSRDHTLLVQGYLAQNIYDADASASVAAQSALAAAQAALVQANASTSQSSSQATGSQYTAQAQNAAIAVSRAQVAQVAYNLQHTIITSPVDGTVVARNVSVGQTVAASFQTPTLFTIAQNLQKMQVDIAVGESDIGNLRVGNGVDFTVLAYPSKIFHGVVSQVRVNPTTVSNVVTYDVVTLVDNPKTELLPGMTANATINVAVARNALVVPTQALSWRPATAAPRTGTRKSSTPKPSATGLTASPWGQTAPGVGVSALPGATGMLFVRSGSTMHAVRVRVDLISGTQAAVTPVSGTLNVGDAVVISDSSQGGTRSTRPATTRGPTSLGRPIH